MLNVGAGIYNAGKSIQRLGHLDVWGTGPVYVTSPRAGLIQLGDPDLFGETSDISPAYSAFLLTVLFHEARHSDGNRKTAGFLHAICPDGTYQGLAACDRNLNGPYSVEAALMKSFIANCDSCQAGHVEKLKLILADTLSRIIKSTVVQGQTVMSDNWDDTPEGE
jgi:hypothetical protein